MVAGGLWSPSGSPTLNARRQPKGPGLLRGGRLSPSLGLRSHESPALWRLAPGGAWPLGKCPSVSYLGLGLGPRSPEGPARWLCGELGGQPR